jgi:hypothetical protein
MSDQMKFVRPITITDAKLISSTVPETDYALWVSTGNYAFGDKVLRPNHHVYKNLNPGVNSNLPENSTTGTTPRWLDCGADNRWAMFDNSVATATTSTDPITVVVAPGAINSICFIGLSFLNISLSITSASAGGGIVYNRALSLNSVGQTSWYTWLLTSHDKFSTTATFTDLPRLPDCVVTITLSGIIYGTTLISCGLCAFGTAVEIGTPEYGYRAPIQDYSVKTIDDYGNYTGLQRPFVQLPEFTLNVYNDDISRVYRALAEIRSIPCVWIASSDKRFDFLTIYAIFQTIDPSVEYYDMTVVQITLLGMT